jgi:RND superfamily putative drug exporter
MMKYLAFGLVTALVLDATVVRMFLVPSVMKLLGDECWWAPRWMKRLHTRIGLGEIGLPDERKPQVEAETEPQSEKTLVTAGAPVPPLPHDPTRPAVGGSARAEAAAQPESIPSLATTVPMHNDGIARTAAAAVAQTSMPSDSATNGNGEVKKAMHRRDGDEPAAARAIPTQLQQDPDAT